jgi:hypothetical protein
LRARQPEPTIAIKKTTQLTLSGGFLVNVTETLDAVAKSLNKAAQKPGTLVELTSAAFISGVSDKVYVNPAHVTMVVEMPGEPPPPGATSAVSAQQARG